MTDDKFEEQLRTLRPPDLSPALKLRIRREAGKRPVLPFIECLAACLFAGMNLAMAIGVATPQPYRTSQAASPQQITEQLQTLGIEPELAGIARFGFADTRPVTPSLNVRGYRSFTGERL